MKTDEAMQIALDMAGFSGIPADTAIHVNGEFTKPLVAIDVGVAELLLAKELGCDGVIAHHPIGVSLANFHRVLSRHVDFMKDFGLKGNLTSYVEPLVERSKLRAHIAIVNHIVDAARHLGLPLMNIHLPCDEIGRKIMGDKIKHAGSKVKDVITELEKLPEFNCPIKPEVVLGSPDNERGKTVLVVAAGTNGGYQIAKSYFLGGADTLLYLHIDLDDLRKLREDPELRGKNLILIGHEPGDSIGINAYLKELEKRKITPITIGITGREID